MPTHVALLRGINVGGRTRAELAQVVADNPFPDEPNPRWVHAIFRNGPLPPDELAALADQQRAQDQAATTRRGWSGPPCSCTPPAASAAASWQSS
jgi:uncharacterized protein (DUF1697 family)